jgi:hypothetical protein
MKISDHTEIWQPREYDGEVLASSYCQPEPLKFHCETGGDKIGRDAVSALR